MLKPEEIQQLLEELSWATVVENVDGFPYRIQQRGHGYSTDKAIGSLQAKLSIMLQVATGDQ